MLPITYNRKLLNICFLSVFFSLNDKNVKSKVYNTVFSVCMCYILCHRPPNLPPKPYGSRRPRPRSVFKVKLFNGNLEAFIKVLNSNSAIMAIHVLTAVCVIMISRNLFSLSFSRRSLWSVHPVCAHRVLKSRRNGGLCVSWCRDQLI